jgi:hypothetical protein
MSNIGAKYTPPSLKKPIEEAVNAMTTQVAVKSSTYVLPSLRKGGELFPELIGLVPVTTAPPKLSFAALLKAKETVNTSEDIVETNDITNTPCQNCHNVHPISVVDISRKEPYVPDPYYKFRTNGHWTKRPPTAMKRRSLFDDDNHYYVPDEDSIHDNTSKASVVEDIDSDGSESYEYEDEN